MTYKHSPGPLQYAFEGGAVAFILESDGTTVARLSVTENTTAHSALTANARLFSAAPELLGALRGLLDALPSATTHPAIKAARAAISRATGDLS